MFDDGLADYADDTSVPATSAQPALPELWRLLEKPVEVTGSVWAPIDSPWLDAFFRRYAAGNSLKWDSVREQVLDRHSRDAAAIRDGLRSQPVVVTDPNATLRGFDLRLVGRRQIPVPLGVLMAGGRIGRLATLPLTLEQHRLGRRASRFVARQTLWQSGVGWLAEHMQLADSKELDGFVSRRNALASGTIISVVSGSLGHDLRKTARLAAHGTALVMHLMDPDHPRRPAGYDAAIAVDAASRWGTGAWYIGTAAVQAVADRHLVVDRGHADVIGENQRLHEIARALASRDGSSDNERALQASLTVGKRSAVPSRPDVVPGVRVSGDDAEFRVAVADVLAGFARHVIASGRFVALARQFRHVVYNGSELTPARASRIDADISAHRKFVRQSLQAALSRR